MSDLWRRSHTFAEEVFVSVICVKQECRTKVSLRASDKSVKGAREVRISYTSVNQGCLTEVSRKCVKSEFCTKVSSKSALPKVSGKCAKSESPAKVSSMSVLQECQERVSRQSVLQGCRAIASNKRVLPECQMSVSSHGVPQVCPVENVTSFAFVYEHTCQHSGLWVSSCFSHGCCPKFFFS